MGCKRRARVSRDGDGGGGGEEEPAPAAAESKSLYEVAPGGADGGASPDSLRNTPSNIARLEDAIEHCAARRKYLARTKSPSDGEDVRWYSCKGHPPPPPPPSASAHRVLALGLSCFRMLHPVPPV
ncbi:Os04g0264900 [Oryza sativa Japonica Group]|uniref:Os04g0264900 protein n=1 Tax=Oryza sativa subsp. japonica TaxID=39947 RepID=A0A0P0W857_ORYSJ|nr:uncharacterized protein LOC112938628 isoform X1 [Oryza sativa Japonica Group]BAS88296.1 Os04g0264900 [Oryza sativa Japonica Group]